MSNSTIGNYAIRDIVAKCFPEVPLYQDHELAAALCKCKKGSTEKFA